MFGRLRFRIVSDDVSVCKYCRCRLHVRLKPIYGMFSIYRLVTSYYRCVMRTDLWTRPYVDTSCILAVHDLNTVRAAVALGDTYKHVIPFTNIMLPSHARSPWNRNRYQRLSVFVPLMYDAAHHRLAFPCCALSVVVSLLPQRSVYLMRDQ